MSDKNKSLKNFSIENLFSTNNTKPHTQGKLDINTLFKNNTKSNNLPVDATILLNRSHKRKLKLDDVHKEVFNSCWRTINEANDAGFTDIFYSVPEHMIDCIDYDPLNCVKYIKSRLAEECISSIRIKKSNTKMFITWEDLEKRLKEKADKNNNSSDAGSMAVFG